MEKTNKNECYPPTNSNKLIAEFMDLRSTGLSIYKPSEYKYHKSWDWLMPVIEKCYQEHMSKHIADAVMTCNIDKAYQVVIQFIIENNEYILKHGTEQ